MWVLLADNDPARFFDTLDELLEYLKWRAPVNFHYFKSTRELPKDG